MSDQPRAANVYTIPIIDGVEHDWTQMDAFDRRFDHLVANTLHSDMFVRIDTSGQLVPAHRFAIGSANERLKRLVYGPKESSTNTDETSGCDLETIEGKPVLVVKDISPEHCHEFLKLLYNSSHPLSVSAAHDLLKHTCTAFGPFPELQSASQTAMNQDTWPEFVLPIYSTIYNSNTDDQAQRRCVRYLQYIVGNLCTVEATRKGDNIFQLPIGALETILNNSSLHIESEVVLFIGLIRWARSSLLNHAGIQGDPTTRYEDQQKLRTMCNGRLELIRLSALSVDELRLCLDEIESPNMIHGGDYGAGFFSMTELRQLTKGKLKIHHSHQLFLMSDDNPSEIDSRDISSSSSGDEEASITRRCVVPIASRKINHNELNVAHDFNIVDTPNSSHLPAYAEPHAEMSMLQQSWKCRLSAGRIYLMYPPLNPRLGFKWSGADGYVGGNIAFEVREQATNCRLRQVILGGMTVHVDQQRLLSVHLVSGWTTEAKRCPFRFQRLQRRRGNECRIWLKVPVILKPNVLYRLVIMVDRQFSKFETFDVLNLQQKIEDGPFWVPVVVKKPAGPTAEAFPTYDKFKEVTVNVSTLFYDYLE